jgi:CheY-like chemotaxis protein
VVKLDPGAQAEGVGASQIQGILGDVGGMNSGSWKMPPQGDGQHARSGSEIDDGARVGGERRHQLEQAFGLGTGDQNAWVHLDIEIGELGRPFQVLERLSGQAPTGQILHVGATQGDQPPPLMGWETIENGNGHPPMLPESPPMARILVADDAASIRLLVKRYLQADGHEVIEAEDGVAAYEYGISDEFDLAILDQLMPGLKGIDVLHKWRQEGRNFPVVVLSGVDDEATVINSLDMGAADYVRKPFSPGELKARVERFLGAG